jgi:hypothetical protein
LGERMRQKQVYSVVKRPNIPVFGGKKPSRREGIKRMGILENAILTPAWLLKSCEFKKLSEKVNLKLISHNIWEDSVSTPPYSMAGTSQSPLLTRLS